MLSELDRAVHSVVQWSNACPHTLSITSVIRIITVYQMKFETNLYNDCKMNNIFINNTY
jgi:hypothetical protein